MPTFDASGPITAVVEIPSGDIHLAATERLEVSVEVSPLDASRDEDVEAAERAVVDYDGAHLVVRVPEEHRPSLRPRRGVVLSFSGSDGSVRVRVELPRGSDLRTRCGSGRVLAGGVFGDCHCEIAAAGEMTLSEVGSFEATLGRGEVNLGVVAGDLDLSTSASGTTEVGGVGGRAKIALGRGDTSVGEVAGDIEVITAASGSISIERAGGSVTAKAGRGEISLGTASGDVELSIAASGVVTARSIAGGAFVTVGRGDVAIGEIGRDADVAVSASGSVGIDLAAGALTARVGRGQVTLGRVAESLDAAVASSGSDGVGVAGKGGTISIGRGDVSVGGGAGPLDITVAASGQVVVDHAGAGLTVRVGRGNIRIGQAQRGTVSLDTNTGNIDVGIKSGVVAWLDLDAVVGQVRTELIDSEAPVGGDDTVRVRAHTGRGDISVSRSEDHALDPADL
jgi:DUF4097 and DUF4098 domain-containing protein YvlB